MMVEPPPKLVAVWQTKESGDTNYDIVYQILNPDLTTVGSNVVVGGTGINEGIPRLAAMPDGGFAITFETGSLNAGANIEMMVFGNETDSFAPVTTPATILHNAGTGYAGDIAVSTDGTIAVTWKENSDIFVQYLTPKGEKAGTPIEIDPGSTHALDNPSITAMSDGSFVVSYDNAGGQAMSQRLFAAVEDTPKVIALSGHDVDGDTLTSVITDLPNNGNLYQVVLDGDGKVTYDANGDVVLGAPIMTEPTTIGNSQGLVIFMPTAAYSGSDDIGFTVTDGNRCPSCK